MNKEEIIFSQNFYVIKENGICDIPDDIILKRVLEALLNSKEFTDTSLRISNRKCKSNLLTLEVTCLDKNAQNFYVSGLYYVTDGFVDENRSFYGEIIYNYYEMFSFLTIERYTKNQTIKVDLGEKIKYDIDTYDIFTSYSNMETTRNKVLIDRMKIENFISNTSKKLINN